MMPAGFWEAKGGTIDKKLIGWEVEGGGRAWPT